MDQEKSIKNIITPQIYHREYVNDLPKQINTPVFQQCLRITQIALPFISLYKPLGQPLSIAMGSVRVVTSFAQMASAIASKDPNAIGKTVLETAIAATALACSILAHPLGMVVTTAHDMITNVTQLIGALQSEDYQKAAEIGLHLMNNALYLGCFVTGSLEWSIASIGCQIFLGLYSSIDAFKNGNYLEGCGHVLMAGIRGKQMHEQVHALQMQKKFEKALSEVPKKKVTNSAPLHGSDEEKQKLLQTQLYDAVQKRNVALAESLIRQGARVDLRDEKGYDALYYAVSWAPEEFPQKNYEMVKMILKYKPDLNRLYKTPIPNLENPPLLIAMQARNGEVARLLLEHGADANYINSEGMGALSFAINYFSLPWVKLLVEKYKIDINSDQANHLQRAFDSYQRDFFAGRREKHYEIIEYLLQRGIDPSSVNKHDYEKFPELTALMEKYTQIRRSKNIFLIEKRIVHNPANPIAKALLPKVD